LGIPPPRRTSELGARFERRMQRIAGKVRLKQSDFGGQENAGTQKKTQQFLWKINELEYLAFLT
jgi:hypothetical protein